MSDIKAGDLVRVANICCESHEYLIGRIGIVSSDDLPGGFRCRFCGAEFTADRIVRVPDCASERGNRLTGWFVRSWLRKIPPLSELEEHREEATA